MIEWKVGHYVVLLDDEDLPKVLKAEEVYENKWFVVATDKHVQLKVGGRVIQLGRFLLQYEGSNLVDHKDRNPLNNQKNNLRVATPSVNRLNSRVSKNSPSGVNGVRACVNSKNYPWAATIANNGKRKHLGYYKTKEEAIVARRKAELEILGHTL